MVVYIEIVCRGKTIILFIFFPKPTKSFKSVIVTLNSSYKYSRSFYISHRMCVLIVFQHGTINAFVMIMGFSSSHCSISGYCPPGHHSKTMATEFFKSCDHNSGSSVMVM